VTDTAGTVLELGTAGPMRDALVASVLSGENKVTSSLLVQYEDASEPVPKPGARILVGSEELPVAVVEVSAVDLLRLVRPIFSLPSMRGRASSQSRGGGRHTSGSGPKRFDPLSANPASLHLNEDTRIVVERFRLVEPRPARRGMCRPRTRSCAPARW
jgi:uncharacterized protein YhfF